MEDLKIETSDYTGYDVEGMPDSPTSESWTAASIKERFDALVKDLVAVRFNALVDALLASTGTSGAEEIGSLAIAGVTGTKVHDQLSDLKTQLDNAVLSGLTEDTITDAYLSSSAGNIKPNYAAHIIDYLLHIGNAGTTAGSGSAYTATLSDFDDTAVQFFVLTAHAACVDNATLSIGGGTAYQIVALGSTNIKTGHMLQNGTYLIMWDSANTKYVLLNPEQTNDHTHAISDVTSLQTSLDGKQATITGGASLITTSNLTTNRALLSNSSGKVAVSAVTSTELGYLDGVSSNVQTQLNAKQATVTGGASTITSSNLTASRALVSNSSGKVAVSAVTLGELGYLDGVTSNVQTQLNAKFATSKIIYSSSTPSYVAGAIWLKPIS